jgi:hypothetical protein
MAETLTRVATRAAVRYAEAVRELVKANGGSFVFAGHLGSQVIGAGGEAFPFVSIMRYPSRS